MRNAPTVGLSAAAATEAQLQRIAREVSRRTNKPLKKDDIGVKVGRVLNKYKVGKHFRVTMDDNPLSWERKEQAIELEAGLDGFYVIRTSEPSDQLSAGNAVRSYKRLADVEQAFRSLKSLELLVRPIHHRPENRVQAHVFLCLLAYYVQWHLKRAWSPLLFAEEQLDQHRAERDPVASAQPTDEAQTKKRNRESADGNEVQSFRTLINELATQCENTCEFGDESNPTPTVKLAAPTRLQTEAFRLLATYRSQRQEFLIGTNPNHQKDLPIHFGENFGLKPLPPERPANHLQLLREGCSGLLCVSR